jgi:hypothetical protein
LIIASFIFAISDYVFYLLACVLRFACRKSLLGEVNQVVLG